VKKIISVGVALALLAMVVLPVGVAAQADEPRTYATTPFAILAALIDVIGELVDMANSKFGLGLPEGGVSQFTDLLSDFTYGPLSWTVDMLAWGLDIVAQVADPVVAQFMPDYGWIVDILNDLVCKLYRPWGDIECAW
jgi:hypothetical protein